MRPYTRSLHSDDYFGLQSYIDPLMAFEKDMTVHGVPHREWHTHRLWEYGSILQELDELHVPKSARLLDVGSGASFFPPYLDSIGYYNLELADSMKYGDITDMVHAQRVHYNIRLPLIDCPIEAMRVGDEVYDVTMCISTIEHVDDHDAGFRELVRITKPNGLIMLTSDFFRDVKHFEESVSRHLQVTDYNKDFVLDLPNRFPVSFVGDTDLDYRGDFIHNYSFCNVCLRRN